MSNNNLTADQQVAYNILVKVYMAQGQSLLSAQLNYRQKFAEDLDAAVAQIKKDWEMGKL